ncbi:MAG: thymidine phosphorylase [Candidatus Kapaibacterium sp.]
MLTSELLKKKRDGYELSSSEIKYIIEGLSNNNVSDVQASAFLMACCTKGLSSDEITALTFAMRDSGKKFDFSGVPYKKVDKHSTGGVGDKISLLLTPICMEYDIAVPMISGRGLGHTGGTADKLEAISGFKIKLHHDVYKKLLIKNRVFMACQTDEIAPADKKLYFLRDVTGTVESTGLICASILSKKLAEDLDALVIDLKVGQGAFMQTINEAYELAEVMKSVASLAGLKLRIIFSSMKQPLGYKIGNWLEIEEVLDCLSGNCPDDIRRLTVILATAMLDCAGISSDNDATAESVSRVLDSGKAYDNFIKMIESQGGNLDQSKIKYKNYPKFSIIANDSGYITQIDTLYTGITGIMLKAGRQDINERIDYGAGIILKKKVGDAVEKGEVLAVLKSKDSNLFKPAADLLSSSMIISPDKPEPDKLILDEWMI